MAAQVNFNDTGVQIDNVYRKTGFSLSQDAWDKLIEYNNEISKFLQAKKEFHWILDQDKNIRISISNFNDNVYVHIREWFNEHPTRKGVSFMEKDWKELAEELTPSPECKLGKTVMTTLMRLETKNMIMNKECEGCVNEWPSQRDHECLMSPEATARAAMDKAENEIKPQDFILMLAQEAAKEGLVLEKPHDTFKKLKQCHMDSIKDAVVKADYSF